MHISGKRPHSVGTLLSGEGLFLGLTVEAIIMMSVRIPAAAMLLAGLTLSVAAAERARTENTISDTSWQHHLWSQKFDTVSDPEPPGSVNSQPVSGMATSRPDCAPAGLMFSHPPLP